MVCDTLLAVMVVIVVIIVVVFNYILETSLGICMYMLSYKTIRR